MDQAFAVVLTENLGFIWDVSLGRLVRDSPNRFDGVNFAGTGQVYSVGESFRQFAAVVFPVASWDFVFNDEQTRFDIDFYAFSVGHSGNERIEPWSLPKVRRDAVELAENSAGLAIGVLKARAIAANVALVRFNLLDDLGYAS